MLISLKHFCLDFDVCLESLSCWTIYLWLKS
uniref:Uncharacterized protein n=1 Tax=Anguilla anguilla TaxID=7936 RepID=A0A0E9TT33_ANGAN